MWYDSCIPIDSLSVNLHPLYYIMFYYILTVEFCSRCPAGRRRRPGRLNNSNLKWNGLRQRDICTLIILCVIYIDNETHQTNRHIVTATTVDLCYNQLFACQCCINSGYIYDASIARFLEPKALLKWLTMLSIYWARCVNRSSKAIWIIYKTCLEI